MARGGGRRLAARGADELASELEGGPRPTSAPACSSRSASSSTWSCNPTNRDTAVSHLHPAGVKVFAYVRTCYGGASCPPMYPATYATDVNSVWGYIQNAFSHGADGVFLDEATSDAHSGDGYYSTLYDDVHTNYPGKQVIINPGVAGIAESTLSVSDIVSVECQWASFNPSWKTTYDAKRFMGLDGCDPTMTASTANTHAQQARANHVDELMSAIRA